MFHCHPKNAQRRKISASHFRNLTGMFLHCSVSVLGTQHVFMLLFLRVPLFSVDIWSFPFPPSRCTFVAPLYPPLSCLPSNFMHSVCARSPCMHFGQKIVHRAPLRVFNSCSHTLPVFSTQSVSLREDVYLFGRGSANDEQMLERNCEH